MSNPLTKLPFNKSEPDKASANVNRVLDKILALTSGNFYGKLHLTFENGKIVHVIEEKHLKL
jgi:hypothetical protein